MALLGGSELKLKLGISLFQKSCIEGEACLEEIGILATGSTSDSGNILLCRRYQRTSGNFRTGTPYSYCETQNFSVLLVSESGFILAVLVFFRLLALHFWVFFILLYFSFVIFLEVFLSHGDGFRNEYFAEKIG